MNLIVGIIIGIIFLIIIVLSTFVFSIPSKPARSVQPIAYSGTMNELRQILNL